jgi:hypothetical protein
MHRKLLSIPTILTVALLSACGPAPEPTPSAAEIEATALSIAFTQLALTQAALPTATPLPTDTPLPTATPLPTSTPFATLAPPTATTGADPCQGVPPALPVGDTGQIKIVNKSKGQVSLSLGMFQANSQGECGTYSFSLGVYDTPTATVLAGCYWGYAWVTADEPSIARTASAICVSKGQTVSIAVGTETIGPD